MNISILKKKIIRKNHVFSIQGQSWVKTSLMTRTPCVHDMDPIIMLIPELKLADKFFFTVVKREFNFDTMEGFPAKYMVYDYRVDNFFEYAMINKDYPAQEFSFNRAGNINSTEKSTLYQLISSEDLVEANMNGKVFGELKKIADTLKDEDNPVLMVITFK